MQAPMLSAALGPRAFTVPREQEPTPELLWEQTQARRALQALEQARAEGDRRGVASGSRRGSTGGVHARAARAAATQAKLQRTSTSAANAARIEAERTAAATRQVQAALRSGQPLALADTPSFFSGSHFVPGDVDSAYGRGEIPSARAAASGSQTARAPVAASSRPNRASLSSRRGGDGQPGWDRSPPPATRQDRALASALAKGDELDGSDTLSPRRRLNQWSRRVDRRQREADGTGTTLTLQPGGMETMMPPPATGSQSARVAAANEDEDPFPLAASRTRSLPSRADDGPQSLQESLRSYTGQWWIRLHNSENKVNSSPYYVGNKSVYYPEKPRSAAVAPEESKESMPLLPRIGSSAGTSSSARGSDTDTQTLRKLVHSSPLDAPAAVPPAAAAGAPGPSRLHSLLFDPPAGSAARQAAVAHAAAVAASGSRVLGTSHQSSRYGSAPQRLQVLLQHATSKPLQPHELSNLAPAWAHSARLLTWKRQPDTMTLADPASAASVAAASAAVAAAPASQPDSDDGLSRARAIRAATRKRNCRFQYDAVSELHGFLSQRNIKALLKATNYNRRELYVIYCRFKALCALSPSPHGIDQRTFKTGVSRLAVEDDRFVSRVFSLVDDDDSGAIEFEEFLKALAALEKGDLETKVRFFFSVYDLDADGYISRQDLATMFKSSSMLADDATTEEVVQTFVARVFAAFGATEAGRISFDDVLRYMRKHGDKEDVWDVFGRSMLQDFGGDR